MQGHTHIRTSPLQTRPDKLWKSLLGKVSAKQRGPWIKHIEDTINANPFQALDVQDLPQLLKLTEKTVTLATESNTQELFELQTLLSDMRIALCAPVSPRMSANKSLHSKPKPHHKKQSDLTKDLATFIKGRQMVVHHHRKPQSKSTSVWVVTMVLVGRAN